MRQSLHSLPWIVKFGSINRNQDMIIVHSREKPKIEVVYRLTLQLCMQAVQAFVAHDADAGSSVYCDLHC